MNVYGEIVTANDVTDAVETTLRSWMPAYLGEVAAQAQLARDTFPAIRAWTGSSKGLNKNVENQLPACIIICPGITNGTIEIRGDGSTTAEFAVGVGLVVSAKDQDETNTVLGYYVAAARTAIMQHQSLGGFAANTRWIDETLDELPVNDSRTLAGGVVNLGVRVDSVLNSRMGLTIPPVDFTVNPPVVETVTTTGVTSNGNVPTPPTPNQVEQQQEQDQEIII